MNIELLSFGPSGYGDELLVGLSVTLLLSIVSFVLSAVLGLFMAIAVTQFRPIELPWRVYRSIVTGVPSLLVIFFIFYNLPVLSTIWLGSSFKIDPWTSACLALTLVYAAYMCELFAGAIGQVGKSQIEAGQSLGLTMPRIWLGVLLPQALRLAVGGLGNLWIVILKETSLVSLVGIADIFRVSNIAARSTGQPLLFFGAVGVVFILLAALTNFATHRLERRLTVQR